VTWIFANIIPALAIWGAMTGVPLWLVLTRRYAADMPAQPAQQSAAALPADRALPVEAELRRVHRNLIRAQRGLAPVHVPVAASR
jgi:hypothetical protein